MLLEDVFWFQEGPGVRTSQFRDSGVKLLNVSNILSGRLDLSKSTRHLDFDEVTRRYSHFLVDEGDLVIASSGISFDRDDGLLRTRGAFVEKRHLPLCMNTSTIRFKEREGVSDLRFLRYWLDSVEFRTQITRVVTGSAQQNFGPSHLRSTSIALPPLEKQKQIAAILDAAEALREKRRQAIKGTRDLQIAYFYDLFGDPALNPKQWPVARLGDLARNEDGRRVPVKAADREGKSGIYPYYGASGVIDYVDEYIFEGDRLLVGEDGANLLARSSPIAFMASGRFWVNNHAHVLASNGRAELRFLEFLIGRTDLKPYVSGTAQPKLTQASLARIPVILPPLQLQRRFCELLKKSGELQARQNESAAAVDGLMTSLQHRAFRGEL